MLDPRRYVRSPSGLLLPAEAAERRYVPRRPIAVDLFSGCGGFGLGFIQAGYEVVAAVEWEVEAAITYMTNLCRYGELTIHFVEESDRSRFESHFSKSLARAAKKKGVKRGFPLAGSGWISGQPRSIPDVKHFFFGDIRKLSGDRILKAIGRALGEIDCVTGGPPCQGYSVAGRREVMDPRNSLVFDFARLILELHPKSFVFENVPGITSMVTPDGVPVLDAFARILEDGNFMGIEALRRTVEAQVGAVGALRSKPVADGTKGGRKSVPPMPQASDQPDLFSREAAE